jgi:hypothetical protein
MTDACQDESARFGLGVEALFRGHPNITREQPRLARAALPLTAGGRYLDTGGGRFE